MLVYLYSHILLLFYLLVCYQSSFVPTVLHTFRELLIMPTETRAQMAPGLARLSSK